MSRLRDLAVWAAHYIFWLIILWAMVVVLVLGVPEINPFRYMNF